MRSRRKGRPVITCLGVVGGCVLAVILVSHFAGIKIAGVKSNSTAALIAVVVLAIVVGMATDNYFGDRIDGLAAYIRSRISVRRSGRGPAARGRAQRTDRTALAGPNILAVARLMPAAAGRRWLAEADSYLFEATPEQRAMARRNYLITAPHVIVDTWARHLARRARLAVTGRTRTAHPR
jgi:hypothetical protein